MRDYVSTVRALPAAVVTGRQPVRDPAVLRLVKAAATDREGHARVVHVQLEGGQLSEEGIDILSVFSAYFESLLASEKATLSDAGINFQDSLRSFLGDLPHVRPTKSIVPLVAPVSATELWVAIKGANVASTPGPDGIPAAFYREFSPVVREPLLNMVNG